MSLALALLTFGLQRRRMATPGPAPLSAPTVRPAETWEEVESWMMSGRLKDAERAVDAALEADPSAPRWLSLKARLMAERGWYQEATAFLKPHIRPGAQESLLYAYVGMLVLSDPSRLIREMGAARDLRPDIQCQIREARLSSALAEGRGDVPRLTRELDRLEKDLVAALVTRPMVNDRVTLGILYAARGDLPRARRELEQALAAHLPENYRTLDIRMALGYVALRQDDMKTAREQFGRCLRLLLDDRGSNFVLSLGYTEQLMRYMLVYFDEPPRLKDLESLRERYARMREEGVRTPSPGERSYAELQNLLRAWRRKSIGEVLLALGDGRAPDANALAERDQIMCIFARTIHADLAEHSRLILLGDAYREMEWLSEASRMYRAALDVFPNSRFTRKRLERFQDLTPADASRR